MHSEMVEIDVLKQIQNDLAFIKRKVSIIEEEVDAISGIFTNSAPNTSKSCMK